VALVVLVRLKLLVVLVVLVLVVHGEHEAAGEDTHVHPEGPLEVHVGTVLELSEDGALVGVATEEEAPSAHESVGTNARSAVEHNVGSGVVGEEATTDGAEDADKEHGPEGLEVESSQEDAVEDLTTEEASEHTQDANADPDLAAQENANEHGEDKADNGADDGADSGAVATEGSAEQGEEAEGEDSSSGSDGVREELASPEANEEATDNEDGAHDPEVLGDERDVASGGVDRASSVVLDSHLSVAAVEAA